MSLENLPVIYSIIYEVEDDDEYLVRSSAGLEAEWLSTEELRSKIDDDHAIRVCFREWKGMRSQVIPNYHVHGATLFQNASEGQECSGCKRSSVAPEQIGTRKRSRADDDTGEGIDEFLSSHASHSGIISMYSRAVLIKVRDNDFVPFDTFSPTIQEKGVVVSPFERFCAQFWRFVRLALVFFPVRETEFHDFFDLLFAWRLTGYGVSAIINYAAALRKLYRGLDAPPLTQLNHMLFTSIVMRPPTVTPMIQPRLRAPQSSRSTRTAIRTETQQAIFVPSTTSGSTDAMDNKTRQRVFDASRDGKVCAKFQFGTCSETGSHVIKARKAGGQALAVEHLCVHCGSPNHGFSTCPSHDSF
jgi:hypothetical protein